MTDLELIRQLQAAKSLLVEIEQELHERGKTSLLKDGKLKKAPSVKNDPLEFYVNCCTFRLGAEITGMSLFQAYKQWCNGNGSLSRGRKPFLDAIAQMGALDDIQGVIRSKSYTFKNLALKTS